MSQKRCLNCGISKPHTDFYVERSRSDGRRPYCKVCCKNRNAKNYTEHRVERAAYNKKYVTSNRQKINEKNTNWRKNVRLAVLRHYSNGSLSCACCGEPNLEFLCIDHVAGGGNRHRKEVGQGGYAIYIWLRQRQFPEGFRVLCFNCNYAVIDGKPCPHTFRESASYGGILSGTAILQNILRGDIEVSPFVEEHLNPASLDLTLGSGVVEYSPENGVLDARTPCPIRRYHIGGAGIVLLPSRAYLMHTTEIVHTERYIPVLDGKSSLGRLFISVHETAGYIDPGFRGQITLEVTVTHPVRVYAGMRFCQVRFHTIVGKPQLYSEKGHYTGMLSMGAVPSQAHVQIEESGK